MNSKSGGLASYFQVKNAIVLVPVCAFAIFDSAFSSFSAVLAEVGKQFPDVSTTMIQMVLSIPSLISIPTMLLTGVLASYIRKRTIGLFSLGILLIAGLIPILTQGANFYIVLASSALIGIGQGFLHPLASSVICEVWPAGDERRKVLGFKQAANYMGAATISLMVGFLALAGWYFAYFVYALTIPVFLIAWFRMPKGELEARLVSHGGAGLRELVTPQMLYLLILFVCACLFQFSYYTNVAMMVSEKGLGTPADISLITSANYLVAFCLGIMYGKMSSVIGDRTLAVGFLILACGLTIASLSTAFPILVIGGLMFGFGSGVQEISTIYLISREATHSATLAMSLALVAVNVGMSLSPIVINTIKEMLGLTAAANAMQIGAVGFVCLATIELLYRRAYRKKYGEIDMSKAAEEDND